MGSLADIEGLLVGHAHDDLALTGCTVVLLPEGGAVCGVDVRGGGPGTRETDLLNPTAMVEQVHAIALCGGSAFGLAAAQGVMAFLYERGIGFETGVARVPIVPAAVIFDLAIGAANRWPDAAMGYGACLAASDWPAEGCVGVGMGATVGKLLGMEGAVKGGIGTASELLADGTTVAALVVANSLGDVVEPGGAIIAGARHPATGAFADSAQLLRSPEVLARLSGTAPSNTTLAVVATDAVLSKAQATKLAQMAQNGLARAIWPVHTPFDGDTVFALATGRRPAAHLAALGTVAADLVARAVWRSVAAAVPLGGLPAARQLGEIDLTAL